MNGLNGVLIIDKPSGITSHDVVARVRRDLKTRSVGHAGTLDPLATGVLVVLLGEATKLASYVTADDKVYSTNIFLGAETDTLDSDGTVIKHAEVPQHVVDALLQFAQSGAIADVLAGAIRDEIARKEQVPPVVSAIHVNGERAHKLARKEGVSAIEMEPRAVSINDLRIESACASPASIDLIVDVAKGYYVRALARDFAARLGTLGHVARLRRISSGAFTLSDATALQKDAYCMLSLEDAVTRTMPTAMLTEEGVTRARHGKSLSRDVFTLAPASSQPTAMFGPENKLVAIGVLDGDVGKVLRGFSP